MSAAIGEESPAAFLHRVALQLACEHEWVLDELPSVAALCDFLHLWRVYQSDLLEGILERIAHGADATPFAAFCTQHGLDWADRSGATGKREADTFTHAKVRRPSNPTGPGTPSMERSAVQASWATLLATAVRTPGLVHTAYQAFHEYSLGNQLHVMVQCAERELPAGPLNTYPGWKAHGRQVRKGEKAVSLCMPVTGKRRTDKRSPPAQEETPVDEDDDAGTYTRFVYRPNWFVLAQTDGAPYQLPPMPQWDKTLALERLGISEVPFTALSGNTQGYATGRQFAINPVAALPHKTLLHELGHIELGHTLDPAFIEEAVPKHLREAEAESVALLCVETLGLDGAVYARGYLQHWLQGDTIPEKSAQKIFSAADRILRAGTKADDTSPTR